MTHCDHESGCRYDAVHDTRRCLQHWEPTRRPASISGRPWLPSPITPRPTMTPALAEAKQAAEAAGFGEPVRFDEPPARGWLGRALERILG